MAACLWSAAYFFCVLCGYFVLRPLRESMGIESGVDTLHWLFLATLGAMLVVNPLFSALVSRVPRRVFIPVTYHFFALNLVAFYLCRVFCPASVSIITGRVFYVWLSVFNLFAVSVFWAFMADGFTLAQGKRLFGFIGVGGTLGAIAGAAIASSLAQTIGTPALLLISVGLLELAVLCVMCLVRRFDRLKAHERPDPGHSADRPLPVGGALHGFKAVATSPYLMGICGYMMSMSILATFMYFVQARIVHDAFETTEQRTAVFAAIDLWAQVLTLLIQLFLTGRLIRRFGVGVTLALLPAVVAAGFVALSIAPSLIALALVQIVSRATRYAIAGPARETLFTVVSREEKYKAKSLIDTFFPRGGDVVGALGDRLMGALAFGIVGATAVAIHIALAWAALGLALGASQTKRAGRARTP